MSRNFLLDSEMHFVTLYVLGVAPGREDLVTDSERRLLLLLGDILRMVLHRLWWPDPSDRRKIRELQMKIIDEQPRKK